MVLNNDGVVNHLIMQFQETLHMSRDGDGILNLRLYTKMN